MGLVDIGRLAIMFWATPQARRQIELLVLAGCLVLTVSTLALSARSRCLQAV